MAYRIRGTCFALLILAFFAGESANSLFAEQPKSDAPQYPLQVLIIRHAEKPPEDTNSVHLSAEGVKRAEALHQLFEASKNRPAPFPTPDFIFAAKDSKQSHRPVETVTEAAKKLKLPIDSRFPNDDFAGLVQELFQNSKYADKTILICWHHGTAPQLAKRLQAADAPASWKGTVYDRVWEISYDATGRATFRDRPQQLLATDSAK